MMKIKLAKKVAASVMHLILTAILLLVAQSAISQTNPSPYTVGKRYNLIGQVTGVISPDPDGGGGRLHAAVRNTYNTEGLLQKVESGELSSWQSEDIKPMNWIGFTPTSIQSFTYDAWARKSSEKIQTPAGNIIAFKQYSYDNLGRLDCEAIRMNPAQFSSLPQNACVLGVAGADGQDRITKYAYNTKDLVTAVIKAYGTSLQQTYATYTYNSFWEKEFITDANGNIARMLYDGYGRIKKWEFPSKTLGGGVNTEDYEEYFYDLNDNRTSFRKRDGQVISYQIDNLNRIKFKDVPNAAADVTYAYDNRGLELASVFTSTNKGITTSYDGFGRVSISTNSLLAVSRTISYEYDDNSNRIKIKHPDGVVFGYVYDGVNKLSNVCENNASQTGVITLHCADVSKEVITPIYDNTIKVKSINLAGGGVTNYNYDSIGRLGDFTHNLSGFTYDVTTSFTYNSVNQVKARSITNDNFLYKENQNVVGDYLVNGLNQYTNAGGKSLTYDNNSNLTSDGSTTFVYDIENRLTSASGAKNATLKYDPKGRLYEVSSAGVTTQFLYDGDALIAEYNVSGALLNRYVHGSRVDEPYLWYEGSSVGATSRRNLYTDYQGSVVAVTDSAASVKRVNTYDVYGIPGTSNLGRFSYTGQIHLSELGLYYYKARIYSPMLGRFLQTDPIGYKDQMNLYTYVSNDPVNMKDITGKYGVPVDSYQMQQYSNIAVMQNAKTNLEVGKAMRADLRATLERGSLGLTVVSVGTFLVGAVPVSLGAAAGATTLSIEAALLKDNPKQAVAIEVGSQLLAKGMLRPAFTVAKELTEAASGKALVEASEEVAGAILEENATTLMTNSAVGSNSGGSRSDGLNGMQVRACSGVGTPKGGCKD